MSYPKHIQENLKKDPNYYSLNCMENIERCKRDSDYLGDVMLVNESLIWHSVHKYIGKPEIIARNHSIEKDDILQLGRVGFIKSIHAFDTTRGVRFSTFAVTAIVREIRCFLRDSSNIIRPTRTANELINRINRLEGELGYLPSAEEVAVLLDADEEAVKKAMLIGQKVKYLDEPVTSHGSSDMPITILDTISDGTDIEGEVLDKVYINKIINTVRDELSDKEANVLQHILNGLDQTRTAEMEGISQMQVSRILKRIAKLLSAKGC